MGNFEDFIDALKEGAEELARETFDGFERYSCNSESKA